MQPIENKTFANTPLKIYQILLNSILFYGRINNLKGQKELLITNSPLVFFVVLIDLVKYFLRRT